MNGVPPKKLMIINILNILKNYSDENHRLSQKDIVDLLQKEYNMRAERKAVKRNLMDLLEFGYDINYDETVRVSPNKKGEKEENVILSNFYLSREFDDSELRLLIDSLLFSKHIPACQRKQLVEKLAGLSNKYFQSKINYIKTINENAPENKQLFYNIGIIDEAIEKRHQISFNYNYYETDKKLHPTIDSDGNPAVYTVNPYQMAATNGRYYLICNYVNHDNLANVRIDRITNIKLLDTRATAKKYATKSRSDLDLPRHMAEHIYMFSGPSTHVSFRVKKSILSDVIDWFGTNIRFCDETEEEVTVVTKVNERAMRIWAMQYGLYVKVLTPQTLADDIKADLKAALKQYK